MQCSHSGYLRTARPSKQRGGSASTPEPAEKVQAKPAAKSKDSKGSRGKGGKVREVEGEESPKVEESQDPQSEQEGGNQAAIVQIFAVKTTGDTPSAVQGFCGTV